MENSKYLKLNSEAGLALIALIGVMLILGVVTCSFIGIVSTHQRSPRTPGNSVKAFYISEGGLEIGKKYVSDWWGETNADPSWAASTDGYYFLYTDQTLGEGTFDLGIHWGTGTESSYASFVSLANVED